MAFRILVSPGNPPAIPSHLPATGLDHRFAVSFICESADVTAKRVDVVGPRMSTSDDAPEVPIICPECETTTRISVEELPESLDRHNDQLHDGDDVAHIDPDIADQLQNLVAKDLGLLE